MLLSIQTLRFIAASLIVLVHSAGEFGFRSFGAFGVDIFFVISGFIIYFVTSSNSKNFIVKRLVRIVPLYWLLTTVTIIVLYADDSIFRSVKFDFFHFLSSLFFIPNWNISSNYQPILKLGWTLNLEMVFYLIFYLSMKISHRHRGSICTIFIVFGFLIIESLDLKTENILNFYSQSIILEFCFGIVIAKVYLNRSVMSIENAIILAVISIFCLSLANYFEQIYYKSRFFYWGLPAAGLVYAAIVLEYHNSIKGRRITEILNLMGDLSYPLYLTHIYIVAGFYRLVDIDVNLWQLFTIGLTLSFMVSYVLNRFYDMPVRRYLTARFN